MSATITELAPCLTITVSRLPAEARRGELERLARDVLDGAELSAYVLRVALRALASPSVPDERLPVLWIDLLEALRLAEDVDSGITHWSAVEPELTCGERQEAAREITRRGAEAALCVLANGEGRVVTLPGRKNNKINGGT